MTLAADGTWACTAMQAICRSPCCGLIWHCEPGREAAAITGQSRLRAYLMVMDIQPHMQVAAAIQSWTIKQEHANPHQRVMLNMYIQEIAVCLASKGGGVHLCIMPWP